MSHSTATSRSKLSFWLKPEAWFLFGVCALLAVGLRLNLRATPYVAFLPPQLIDVGECTLDVNVAFKLGDSANAATQARVRVYHELDDGRLTCVRDVNAPVGTLSLAALPSGSAWVIVDAPGFARSASPLVLYGKTAVNVALLPATQLAVSVVDEQGAAVREATVLIRDPFLAVADARVPQAQDATRERADSLPFGTLTDETGIASFGALPPGSHRIEVFARGYEAAVRDGVTADIKITVRRLGALQVLVRNPDHSAAPGAEVWIVGSSLWPARRVVTDNAGEASIPGLADGIFDLRASLATLVSPIAAGVRLERGEQRRLELQLAPGRFVHVEVFGTRADSTQPVPNARVVLAEQGLSSFPLTAVTGANGQVTLGPTSFATAYVSARAKGFISRSTVPVEISSNQTVRVDLVEGGTLRGTVVDESEYPVVGARVEIVGIDIDGQPIAETPLLAAYREAHFDASLQPMAFVPSGELGITLGPVPLINATTPAGPGYGTLPDSYVPWISDVTGRFRATPVPPGRIRALVRHPEYTDALSASVVLGPGGNAEIKIVMTQGAKIRGRVVDDRGFPVAGARVQATAAQGSYERGTLSATDGMFQLDAVPSNVTIALARPSDPARFVAREIVKTASGQTLEREFTLPAERESVEWQVVTDSGDPVEVAQVSLSSIDPAVPLRVTQFTDARGIVHFDDALGLRSRVTVQASGYVTRSDQFEHAPRERTFALAKGVWVTGIVTAVRGRVPVSGARVTIQAGSKREVTYTSQLGEYQLRAIPPGNLSISVEHDDYASETRSTRLETPSRDDRAVELPVIDLADAINVSGTVVDSDGNPVAGARVSLSFISAYLPRGAEPAGAVRSDGAGHFLLRRVAPGQLSVFALAAGRGRAQIQVPAEDGRDITDLELRLTTDAEPEPPTPGQAGLAITLATQDNTVRIVDVALTSEAERAGLRVGDQIDQLDGQGVTSLEGARERLSGAPGSDVVVRVSRRGTTLDFRVRREELSLTR